MNPIMALHIAGGCIALLAGGLAVAARKGGRLHARAGAAFAAAMLVLGVTATTLDISQGKPGLGGVFACYLVATAWSAARRRDGGAGKLEIVACLAAFAAGGLIVWGIAAGTAPPTPVGMGPVYAIAALCLAAGTLDLSVLLRRRLTPPQRIARHLWRMCVAFFIATGSFFLGQQDVLPQALQGSPALFVLAFAPFAAMALFLARLSLGKRFRARLPASPA